MKLRTHRTNTTKPFEIFRVKKGLNSLQTQHAIEEKVEFVVERFRAICIDVRVEYIRQRANIFGSNGQKVRIIAS